MPARPGAFRGAAGFWRARRRRPVSESDTSISSLTLRSNSGTVASGMLTQTSRSAVSSWYQRSPVEAPPTSPANPPPPRLRNPPFLADRAVVAGNPAASGNQVQAPLRSWQTELWLLVGADSGIEPAPVGAKGRCSADTRAVAAGCRKLGRSQPDRWPEISPRRVARDQPSSGRPRSALVGSPEISPRPALRRSGRSVRRLRAPRPPPAAGPTPRS